MTADIVLIKIKVEFVFYYKEALRKVIGIKKMISQFIMRIGN